MENILLILEYDGTGLSGWQRQDGSPTVQGHLEAALARIVNHPVTVIGAGRTDAGVHARGQAANFRTAAKRTTGELVRGANALLPPQIAVLSARVVPDDFHARYGARSKVYDYDLYVSPNRSALLRSRAWHQAPGLDVAAMAQALAMLRGRHDFAAFQSTGTPVKSTTRSMIAAGIEARDGDLLRITLEADGFLRHMVRALVGTLILVGRGRMSVEEFGEVLASRERSAAGPTAPAHGLYLREVKY